MRILYCITRSDTIGGAQIHVADMAEWMIAKGHAAKVVVGGQGAFCDELRRRSIPFRTCRSLQRPVSLRNDLGAIRKLRSLFRDEMPDLVSLHSTKAGILGRVAALGLPSRVIYTAHGWSFTEGTPKTKAWVYRTIERLMARFADKIITVSNFDRNLALSFKVGRPESVKAIHNGMPDADAVSRPGESALMPRIAMVARLDEPKDHVTLFEAMSQAVDRQWQLDLVGDGPQEPALRKLALALGIESRVNFLGLRNDVAHILASSHLFVLLSDWEGFPRSILEAMRAGLPVVASNVGGVSEAVTEGETGFLVARKDAETFRARVNYLLDQPDERLRMGKNARARFENAFLFDRMASDTLEVYTTLLGARARTA